MRVLIVYHYFAHYRLPLFKELSSIDDVSFLYVGGKECDTRIELIDFDKTNLEFKPVQNYWFFKKKFLYQRGLLKVLFHEEYDTVIFLGSIFHISTWLGVFFSRFIKNKKTIFWMHGTWKRNISLIDVIKIFVFYKLPKHLFLYGHWAEKRLADFGLKNSTVIYNSLNYAESLGLRSITDKYSQISFRQQNFENTLPTVVFVGRVNYAKRIDLLVKLQIEAYLNPNSQMFNLMIIGAGEELELLKKYVEENGLSKYTKFKGAVYDEEKISMIIKYSDICITPGRMGLTAIHSLSYGTPICTNSNFETQMPEVESLIEGLTGFVFEESNINDLGKKMNNWFKLYPFKTEELQARCFKIIDERFNPKVQAEIIKKTLSELS